MNRKHLVLSPCLLAAFILWTVFVCTVDVQPIGPCESEVGMAAVNGIVHNFFGVHMGLYVITDWLGLVPIAFAAGFAVLGLIQWIKRGSILKVDHNILTLGVFYIVIIGAYVAFESLVVNYRPVLIDGCLEASYPSTTTLLVLCVMPTAITQLKLRIKKRWWRILIIHLLAAFTVFMVLGRLISGVHWMSDIIGSILLCGGLVSLYRALGMP